MGCLLAEFKLTAMLYGGRREGTAAFWAAPLCTPPLTLPVFLSHSVLLSLSRSQSHGRNLDRFLDPGVLSGGQLTHGRFHWKICSAKPNENIFFFLRGKKLSRNLNHKKKKKPTYNAKVSSYCAERAVLWTGIY